MLRLALPGLLLAGITSPAQDSLKYWIQFTDKNNNGFSISQPEQFLSARSLERRSKQNIAIDFKDLPVTEAYVDSLRALGANILNRSKWMNAVTISTDDTALMQQISFLPFVKSSQTVKRFGLLKPDDKFEKLSPTFGGQRTFNDYGHAFTQIRMLNGDVVHDIGYTGKGVLIAVIDAGFSEAHTHELFVNLRDEARILATRDFVDGDDWVYDHSGHGTAVLATLAAWYPGEMIGTAYDAEYLLLRSEDVESEFLIEEYNWISAAEFADSMGADILTTSLGYSTFDDSTMNHTYADMDGNTTRITIGSDIAASRGMLVVNSAGNQGASGWKYVTAAADGDSVLAVGSVDADGNYSNFSSQGPTYDGRVKPDVVAMGQGVTVSGFGESLTATSSGTSFSGPIIAGMAACLWEAYPHKSNMDIYRAIIQSAHQYDYPDTLMGYGIPNFVNALYILDQPPPPEPVREAYAHPRVTGDHFTLYFRGKSNSEGTIEAFDMHGHAVYVTPFSFRAETNYAVPFDLSAMPSGLYLFRIRQGGWEVVRVVKVER